MCIFCKIVNGEIPAYKIYEDDDFVAFLDISQASYGHTLVIPKKHYDDIFSIDTNVGNKYMKVINTVSNILKSKLNISNVNIINNSGDLAGQTVKHIHFHIIPRYENDNISFTFPEHDFNKEQLEEIIEKLR